VSMEASPSSNLQLCLLLPPGPFTWSSISSSVKTSSSKNVFSMLIALPLLLAYSLSKESAGRCIYLSIWPPILSSLWTHRILVFFPSIFT